MLDINVQYLIDHESEAFDRLITKFERNLTIYGKQDFEIGLYIKELFFLLRSGLMETNLKLEIYKRLVDVLRKNGLIYKLEDTVLSAIYPYYYGSGAQSLTPVQIQALTEDAGVKSNKSYIFTLDTEVYYVAYPAYYGSLISILDLNGFETIDGWLKRSETFNIGGIDVLYFVYEFKYITTQTSFTNTFKYTK